MKIKDGYLLKKVAGNNIVVPVGDLDFDGLITLNETGVVLWEALEQGCSEEYLTQVLLENYEVSGEAAIKDVAAFLSTLRNENLIDE